MVNKEKMFRSILLMICLLWSAGSFAQNERFFVVHKDGNLIIEHKARTGETVFSVARRYHVPPSMLADANRLDYKAELEQGQIIDVPLAVYNHINEAPEYMNDVRPLFYVVDGRQDMQRVVRITGVPQRKIEKWNKLANNNLHDGQELMVGWVLFDATPIKLEVKEPAEVSRRRGDWSTREREAVKDIPARPLDVKDYDTVIVVKKTDTTEASAEEELYLSQTMNEQRLITEKGPAVFFNPASASSKSLYAFHNTARRGAIIKVFNPGTKKTVYVKVIGAIPGTAQYHNSVIGISATAKEELGVNENKMFCEISYGVL